MFLPGLHDSQVRHSVKGFDHELNQVGVPGFGHRTVGLRYFEWHHSEADTLDKIDPKEFRLNVASLAVMAYVLADMDERIDA